MLNNASFALLHNILGEAFGLSLHRFDSSESDLTELDLGLRVQMQDSDMLYARLRELARGLEFGEIILVRDTLLIDIVLLRADPDGRAFYSIGPFRWLPMEDADYFKVQTSNGLDMAAMETLRVLMQRVPVSISRTVALAVAKNILLTTHGISNPVVRELDLAEDAVSPPPIVPREDINARAKRVADIYAHEERLLSFVREGNEARAVEEAQFFMLTNMDQRLSDRLFAQRSLMYSVNTLFRKAAQSIGIHPLFCDEISRQFAKRLELCSSRQQLTNMYFEMIREYCRLCSEKSTAGYSENIRKVMQYIQLNLGQELNPETVGAAVSFSPGYVSRLFKEEVGMPLSAFITARRVEAACTLLKRSELTVREISAYVGIADWNYFTKVFKKQMGCTPSEYRRGGREDGA